MRILLTGATGFVGQHLLSKIPDHWECYALARRPEILPPHIRAIAADLNNSEWISELPNQMDAIIHLAQSLNYRAFPDQALDVFNVNVNSTAYLLDYACRSGVKQFCLFSTGSVYEPYDHLPLLENMAVQPSSINAVTKLAAENLCRSYESQFSVSILRVFSPYGPAQANRLIPMLIDRITSGNPVDLSGKEGMSFSPIYVSDLVNIAIASIEKNWQGTFNVAGTHTHTVKQLSEMIASIVGRNASYNYNDQSELCLSPSIEKLGKLFSPGGMTEIKTGLEMTILGEPD